MNHSYLVVLVTLCSLSTIIAQEPLSVENQSPTANSTSLTDAEKSNLQAEIEKISQQVTVQEEASKFDNALKLLDKIFEIETKIYGPNNEECLGTLDRKSEIATAAEKLDEAIRFRQQALEMGTAIYPVSHYKLVDLNNRLKDARRLTTLGNEDRSRLQEADRLNSHVVQLYKLGKFQEAISPATKVLNLRKRILGKEHLDYAYSLNRLALIYDSMADYEKAEPLYLEAKLIRKNVLGHEHPDYATILNNLALLHASTGQYTNAELLYLEAKSIKEKSLGKKHPSYATALNNLATLYVTMGAHAKAESMYLEAMDIEEKVLGKEHPDYATSLNNLALLYSTMGDYRNAESFHLEAKEIREKVLGTKHPDYAISLNNLAGIYDSIKDYAKAEPLYLESMAINESLFGKENPTYALVLNNLAALYHSKDDCAKAEPLYLEAKAINEKVLGKEHPAFATSLNNLALLYSTMGDFRNAESFHLEAKGIREKVLGKEHPSYANSLNNLATLYTSMEDYSKAEPFYLETKMIYEKQLGRDHPDYATNLMNLAKHFTLTEDYSKAEPLYLECLATTRKHVEATAAIQTERQQMVMDQRFRNRLDSFLRLAITAPNLKVSPVESILGWKGSVMRRSRGLRAAAGDPTIAEQFSKLQSITAQFSKVAQETPTPKQVTAWRERRSLLSSEKEAIERELIRSNEAFAKAFKPISLADIQQSIPSEAVLVDYLEFGSNDERQLLASVVKRNGEPRFISLGKVSDLSTLIGLWRASFVEQQPMDDDRGTAAGLELRKQIWEPLLPLIGDAKILLVSTDGVLGRLPIGALPGSRPGSYLIEEYPIALIPVPQLLPDLMQEQPSNAQYQLLALGDIDYDNAPTPAKLDQQPASYPDTFASPLLALRSRGQLPDMLRSSAGTWSKLAGTGLEVDYITKLYQRQHQAPKTSVIKLDATSASETAFRELAPHSRVIHVATHGFFASPDKKSALSGESIEAAAKQQMFTSIEDNQRLTLQGFSPGQLSGLVFAGANRKKSEDPLTPDPTPRSGARGVDIGSDDGILTADEIAFMRLENCELIVLSACETNVGAVAGGEGILGLQRAFQQAGARSTISSLWKVEDDATKTLMQLFYTNVWEKKQSKLEALRNAQLEMLNHYNEATQKLDRSAPVEMKLVPKKDPKSTAATDGIKRLSPKYWAAFQLSGDWR